MRSRRNRLEFACRVGVFALLGWLLGTSVFPSTGRRAETVNGAALEARLQQWTRRPPGDALHANLDVTPSRWAVDWLAALQRAGHSVTWTGNPPALAVAAEPIADPRGGARVDVAAPAGTKVVVRDDASVIDSVRITNLGGSVIVPAVVGRLDAIAGGETASVARARLRAHPIDRRRRRVGWEGSFIVAAFEGRGWPVIARFAVAPKVYVGQSRAAGARHVARRGGHRGGHVASGIGGAIERYVQSGGGLILAGPSSLAATTALLAPGALGARFRPAVLPKDTIALGSTGFYPVASLKRRRDCARAPRRRRVDRGAASRARPRRAGRLRRQLALAHGRRAGIGRRACGLVVATGEQRRVRAELGASARLVPARRRSLRWSRGSDPPGRCHREPLRDRPSIRRIFMILIMVLLLIEWASRRLRGLR